VEPSYVRSPEGNGVADRFSLTLKEPHLWVRTFRDTGATDLRIALLGCQRTYNASWVLARHG
jgi:putative transposase